MSTCCPDCGLQKLNADKNNESTLKRINANSLMIKNMRYIRGKNQSTRRRIPKPSHSCAQCTE